MIHVERRLGHRRVITGLFYSSGRSCVSLSGVRWLLDIPEVDYARFKTFCSARCTSVQSELQVGNRAQSRVPSSRERHHILAFTTIERESA